jgi:ABC-2 type transport system permease protein
MTALAPETVATETGRTSAPLHRMLVSELRWVLWRPRNLFALASLIAVPIVLGTAVAMTGGPSSGEGPPAMAMVAGNGLVLPVASLTIAQALLLPLVVSMVAADALAGESSHGTLRGLLLAPVGRARLVWVKGFGVLAMTLLSVTAVAVSGLITGLVIVGSDGLVTLSGTTLPMGDALLRLALAVGWVTVQMAAVGAVALAISSLTDHPLVVMTTAMGGLIIFGVLGTVPQLSWLHPVLITNNWPSVIDVLRDPIVSDNLVHGLLCALCYALIGMSATFARVATKDT